jgi:ankyrin repeat protein
LMFAATYDRAPVVEILASRGADVSRATRLVDVPELDKKDREALFGRLRRQREARAKAADDESKRSGEAPSEAPKKVPPRTSPREGGNVFSKLFGWLNPSGEEEKKAEAAPPRRRRTSHGELVGIQGGMTPLLLAARQGNVASVEALLRAGADVNQVAEGTKTSPLLIAIMNGHFDLANALLERGADPTLANEPAGVTPLYAAINVWYAPKTAWPQPTAQYQQELTHLEMIKALLDAGADPNVRLKQKIWFSAYNFDQSGIDESGATPFWRAAYGSDVAAMRLLKDYGADPAIPTMKPEGRPTVADEQGREIHDVSGLVPVPVGGPAITPLHAASGGGYGEGFAANEHRNHPAGFLPAVKFLVEECGADVDVRDHEGNTALHNAAARGDVAMIEYLVSKGADVTLVNREGQTTADMANGPVQRIQPFPEALALLVSLGAVNNNRCVSC